MLDSTRVFRLSRAVAMDIAVMDYVEAAKLRGERQGADLAGVTEQEHVGAERLAGERRRKPAGVDEMRLVAAGGGQRPAQPFGREREIGVAGELNLVGHGACACAPAQLQGVAVNVGGLGLRAGRGAAKKPL